MHELSAALKIIAAVKEEAARHGLETVSTVSVACGSACGVTPGELAETIALLQGEQGLEGAAFEVAGVEGMDISIERIRGTRGYGEAQSHDTWK